jgi:hypothetical protein
MRQGGKGGEQLRRPAQPGLAVVDVGRAEARPAPGSEATTLRLPAMPGLERRRLAVLLLRGPPAVVAAWRPGRPAASPLDLPVDGAIVTDSLAA